MKHLGCWQNCFKIRQETKKKRRTRNPFDTFFIDRRKNFTFDRITFARWWPIFVSMLSPRITATEPNVSGLAAFIHIQLLTQKPQESRPTNEIHHTQKKPLK